MDPTATLDEIRGLVRELRKTHHDDDVERFVELVDALDAWMEKGGFLPGHWNTGNR